VATRHALLIGVPHYDDDEIYAPLFSLEVDALSPELEPLSSDLDPPGEVLVVD
jgi:hypothetical protein